MNELGSNGEDSQRWQIFKHKMPHKIRDFGYVSIEDTPLTLIVGGSASGVGELDTIYVFNAQTFEFKLSKQVCFVSYIFVIRISLIYLCVNA